MFRCFVCLKHFFKLWNLFCGWGLKAKKKMDWIKISATMFGRRGSIFKSYWLNNCKNFLSSTISPKLVTLLDYHWNLQSLSPYWTGWFFSQYIRIIKQMFNRFLVSQIAFNAFHRRKQSLACSNCCRHNKKKITKLRSSGVNSLWPLFFPESLFNQLSNRNIFSVYYSKKRASCTLRSPKLKSAFCISASDRLAIIILTTRFCK